MDLQHDNYDLKANSIAVNTATDLAIPVLSLINLMRPRPHNAGTTKALLKVRTLMHQSTMNIYQLKNNLRFLPYLQKISCG